MDENDLSVSLEVDSVSSFLRNRASSSVVYLLSLVQPLTQREMSAHPLRLHYLRTVSGRDPKPSSLKGVLKRGRDLGLLVALSTRRESYYFLNSDVGVRPPSLEEHGRGPMVVVERRGTMKGRDICVPPGRVLCSGHPIPGLREPASFLAWFDWLSDPKKREVLQTLQADGPMTRAEMSRRGIKLEMKTVQAAIRVGVLRLGSEGLDFQFMRTGIPPSGRVWTARPPLVWMTRSYEPLRCIQHVEDYLSQAEGKSPMQILEEMAEDKRKVLTSRRRKGLHLNLLYEPTALVPKIEELGPGSLAGILENLRGLVTTAQDGYERAVAAMELEAELRARPVEDVVNQRVKALLGLAQRRLEAYFRRREEELMKRFGQGEVKEYGLGPGAIMCVASVELARERLKEERKYFERFLQVLEGGPEGPS